MYILMWFLIVGIIIFFEFDVMVIFFVEGELYFCEDKVCFILKLFNYGGEY